MRFKAIIFDLDGTAFPNTKEARISRDLIKTIRTAQRKFVLSAATGRVLDLCRPVLKELEIRDLSIISGGTQIINPLTEEIIWEEVISQQEVKEIIEILKPFPYEIFFSDEMSSTTAERKKPQVERFINVKYVCLEDSYKIIEKLKALTLIVPHKVRSWKRGAYDIHITNAKATKSHAIEILLEKLDLKKDEVIGVGDSDNDLPIFESVGFKVAVGNATKILKEKADYIAPSVEEDGLVKVIEERLIGQIH